MAQTHSPSRLKRRPSRRKIHEHDPKHSSKKSGSSTSSPSPRASPTLLYIDLHLVHEVTSPQAFEGLRLAGRKVRRPDRTVATVDHNVPTTIEGRLNIVDQIAAKQIETLRKNCADFGVELYDVTVREQGIVHVIGPELGLTKPGMTIVCGDSHTSTHGAFGALAFGIGTSEVEHVLATQTLPQSKPKTFRISVEGKLPHGVTAKDIILAIIGKIGTAGATGCVVEYAGSAIRALSMEGRMTICNMSIEAGARAGMIAPDETTFAYLKGRRFCPQGAAWDEAVAEWSQACPPIAARTSTANSTIDAADARSLRQLGNKPGHGHRRQITVPLPDAATPARPTRKPSSAPSNIWISRPAHRSNRSPSTASSSAPAPTDASKTCAPPPVVRGYNVATTFARWSSPARRPVKAQAEKEGLDQIFNDRRLRLARARMLHVPRHEPRHSLPRRALRLDQQPQLRRPPGPRRAHAPRQPEMAAAAAIAGHFVDIRNWPTVSLAREGGSTA